MNFLFCFSGWGLIEHDYMFIRLLVHRKRLTGMGIERITEGGGLWENRSGWDQAQGEEF